MAALTTQNISRQTPLTPTYAAVAASDTFTPGANVFLHIKNAGASPDNVTIVTPTSADPTGLVISDTAVTVTNGTERMIGPFPAQFFADPSISGSATINHSFTTSVTIAVLNVTLP